MKRPEPETWRLGTELVGKARSKRFTWGHQKVGHLYFCDLLGKFTKTKAFHKSHWLILNVSYLFMCFSCISFPRSSVCLHVCILFLWLHVTLSYLYLSYAVFINLVLHCVWQPFFCSFILIFAAWVSAYRYLQARKKTCPDFSLYTNKFFCVENHRIVCFWFLVSILPVSCLPSVYPLSHQPLTSSFLHSHHILALLSSVVPFPLLRLAGQCTQFAAQLWV